MIRALIVAVMLLTTTAYAASQYDREITVLNQTRNNKVRAIFKDMMSAYEEKDIDRFFSYISEDRFTQDYMTFYEAIEKDMRVYDVLSIDFWIDKITDDGVKRFLYVRWEKRYDAINSDTQIQRKGYSRFLFDEINGKYKLIGIAGNHFWGGSLLEWREEVPKIAGQEKEDEQTAQKEDGGLPDLVVTDIQCTDVGVSLSNVTFKIKNIGNGSTSSGSIKWIASNGPENGSGTYNSDLQSGESSNTITWTNAYSCGGGIIEVDPDGFITESDDSNNKDVF